MATVWEGTANPKHFLRGYGWIHKDYGFHGLNQLRQKNLSWCLHNPNNSLWFIDVYSSNIEIVFITSNENQ